MSNSKSMLAKLMATENIEVIYGNFKTAWFDVENRRLGMPFTNSDNKDVIDLFTGHEVGHALYTPVEGWHDSPIEFQVPRSFLNVIEDNRIERFIQNKYPGLVSCFKRGYKALFDQDFFGIIDRGVDVNEVSLIDKINLKSKLRDLIDIQFSPEERKFFEMTNSTETWDDVVNVSKAIYEFMRQEEEKKEDQDDEMSFPSDGEGEESQEQLMDARSIEQESFNESEPEKSDGDSDFSNSSDDEDTDEEDDDGVDTGEGVAEPEETQTEETETQSADEAGSDSDLEAETDNSFRAAEEKMNELLDDRGGDKIYIRPMTRSQFDSMISTANDVKADRKQAIQRYKENYWDPSYQEEGLQRILDEYNKFQDDTKRSIGLMAKEFEMRKAAYRTLRASTARTGSLNVDRLHSYKYNDDIFKKITNLADAKSHGLILLVDYSGSMQDILKDVVCQILSITAFCRKVNIPFKVYGFFSTYKDSYEAQSKLIAGDIDVSLTRVFEILDSAMTKAEYEEICWDLYFSVSTRSYRYGKLETLGGTPLNETLLAFNFIKEDFLKKNPVQKLNLIVLSDGAGNELRLSANNSENLPLSVDKTWYNFRTPRQVIMKLNGKSETVVFRNMTPAIVKSIRQSGVSTTCFFLTEKSRDIGNGLAISNGDEYIPHYEFTNQLQDIKKELRKNKVAVIDNSEKSGYDRFFILPAANKNINTEIEEFEVDANASKAQIRKAFSAYSSSKKGNRILASKFAEVIS